MAEYHSMIWGFPSCSVMKNPLVLLKMQKMWVWYLGWDDPLEDGMATHSSILTWRIPWTEEPDRLQSIGAQRVRHDWSDFMHAYISRWKNVDMTFDGKSDTSSIVREEKKRGLCRCNWSEWQDNEGVHLWQFLFVNKVRSGAKDEGIVSHVWL